MARHKIQQSTDQIAGVVGTDQRDGLCIPGLGQWPAQPDFIPPVPSDETHGAQTDVLPAPPYVDCAAAIHEDAELR
jgi:hypothetical protein